MLYLGIDQHARQITISLRDDSGDALHARAPGSDHIVGQCEANPSGSVDRCSDFVTGWCD